jgi:hypothetical protein
LYPATGETQDGLAIACSADLIARLQRQQRTGRHPVGLADMSDPYLSLAHPDLGEHRHRLGRPGQLLEK